jgi:hypothetical protein
MSDKSVATQLPEVVSWLQGVSFWLQDTPYVIANEVKQSQHENNR